MPRHKLLRGFVAFSLLLAVSHSAFADKNLKKGVKMNNSSDRIAALFEKTKAICVGRFLLDVPAESEVIYGPAYMDADLMMVKGGAARLDSIVKHDKDQALEEAQVADESLKGPSSMLGKVIEGAISGQRILFASSGSGLFYEIRSYLPVGDDLFIAWLSSFPDAHRYQEVVEHLTKISRSVKSREENEVPEAQGLCIEGALVNGDGTFMTERATLGIRFSKFPDVHFSVDMTSKDELVESDALEPRLQSAEMEAKRQGHSKWYSSIKFFRRGKRSIDRWDGYEVLARKPKQKVEAASHEFAFVSQGEPKNLYLPVIDIALHTGVLENMQGAVAPSVTDQEAMDIWDRLTGSIRMRPFLSQIVGRK